MDNPRMIGIMAFRCGMSPSGNGCRTGGTTAKFSGPNSLRTAIGC